MSPIMGDSGPIECTIVEEGNESNVIWEGPMHLPEIDTFIDKDGSSWKVEQVRTQIVPREDVTTPWVGKYIVKGKIIVSSV